MLRTVVLFCISEWRDGETEVAKMVAQSLAWMATVRYGLTVPRIFGYQRARFIQMDLEGGVVVVVVVV